MEIIKTPIKKLKDYLKGVFQLKAESSPRSISERELCENLLHKLQPFLGKPYNPRQANEVIVQSNKRDLNQLIQQLKEINKVLAKEHVLQANHCDGFVEAFSLDQLFVSPTNHYIDSEQIITYYDEAIKLCELTQGYEDYSYGVNEHNYRMLMAIFATIKSVSLGLLIILQD